MNSVASGQAMTVDNQRRVLEDVRDRLVVLANDLRPETASEDGLLATAAALETVVHRIRWVADLGRDKERS